MMMKAFWWFKENSIAGMARPGFNRAHWFDLPFDEAIVMGWIGQFSSGPLTVDSFQRHLDEYALKVFKFYNLDEMIGRARIAKLHSREGSFSEGFLSTLNSLALRTSCFENIAVSNDQLYFEINPGRLLYEIDFLKQHEICHVISLTESPHNHEILQRDFQVHHLGIADLNAPTIDQVKQLSLILQKSIEKKEKVAVHCLAGIGRTSTMLIASHLFMGESFAELQVRIAKQNPSFVLTGSQEALIQSVRAFKFDFALDRIGEAP